ncbi:ABC transporter ATP-binding protein [Devriesea agamarum]|uniref:ABC transporter ATP-binding protein n=1 Tax=Devriesea agamarum TaxID=472569 RepID=UPI00071D50C7|nr:ABC transporter ATP-binding protein [Devriesea agamarum]
MLFSRRSDSSSSSAPGLGPRPLTGVNIVLDMIARQKKAVLIGFPLALLSNVLETLTPALVGLTVDRAIMPQSPIMLIVMLFLLAADIYLGLKCWQIAYLRLKRASFEEIHRQRVRITEAVLDPRARPTNRSSGEILSIATSDADRAGQVVYAAFEFYMPVFVTLAGTVIVLLVLDWRIAIAVVIGVVFVLLITRLIGPVMTKRHTAQQEANAEASATATDLVKGLRVLQGLGAQHAANQRYRFGSRRALAASVRNAQFGGLGYGLTLGVGFLMIAVIASLTGYFAVNDRISIGAFIAIIGISQALVGQLDSIGEAAVYWASVKGSANRIADLLNELSHSPHKTQHVARIPAGDLVIDDLTTDNLHGLKLRIEPDQIVGLVCSTPKEAREVLDALHASHANNSSGSVKIGDTTLVRSSALAARDIMLVEPHHVDLFEGTLRDQVLTRCADGSDQDVRNAIDAAGASDVLTLLPDGMDSEIQEGGTNLSGGQRQRVALARAFAAKTPILILHDPTTAVDAVTEQKIADGMTDFRRGNGERTLLITHAPALLTICDRVVFVRDGHVAAAGSHHNLAREVPLYTETVLR